MYFADLFCGAGGWTCGLKEAGLTPLFALDSDRDAIETYKSNHGGVGVCADVRTVRRETFLRALGTHRLSLLVASPPCKTFSVLTRKSEVAEGDDDLWRQVLKFVRWGRPEAVAFENVPAFATKGAHHARLGAALRRCGYLNFASAVLKCEEYGVPQARRRLIMVASRRPFEFRTPRACGFSPHMYSLLTPRSKVPAYCWLPRWKVDYFRNKHEDRRGRFVSVTDRQHIARTVCAGYSQSRGQNEILQYGDGACRMLSLEECAKIQSFPESYVWCGATGKRYVQVGNAVPPRLAFNLGRMIRSQLCDD